MATLLNIPLITPFKFVPVSNSPGIHFDDKWAYEQRLVGDMNISYRQKWVKTDTTDLVIESSLPPDDLKVYEKNGNVVTLVHSIPWTVDYAGISTSFYKLVFDISALPDAVYLLYQRAAFGSVSFNVISEPIHSKSKWPGTLLFTYKHSFNDYDVVWTTGTEMKFRCEACLPPAAFEPILERNTFVNQIRNVKTTKGRPYRTFKLDVGQALPYWAKGVAPWVLDLLNRIFHCDSIDISGKKFQANNDSKWEKTFFKGNPLVFASLEVVEGSNRGSLQISDTTPLAPGLVTAYNIETDFFGENPTVSVTEVEENG